MALEDAVALAAAHHEAGSTEAALAAYEDRRRGPVEANTAASAQR